MARSTGEVDKPLLSVSPSLGSSFVQGFKKQVSSVSEMQFRSRSTLSPRGGEAASQGSSEPVPPLRLSLSPKPASRERRKSDTTNISLGSLRSAVSPRSRGAKARHAVLGQPLKSDGSIEHMQHITLSPREPQTPPYVDCFIETGFSSLSEFLEGHLEYEDSPLPILSRSSPVRHSNGSPFGPNLTLPAFHHLD